MRKLVLSICFGGLLTGVHAQVKLYPIQIKGKWGYTNAQGKLAIAADYDYAENFYEGFAVVALNNQPCVINELNKRIIDTGLYANIQRYSEGLAKVTDFKHHQYFVDYEGNQVVVVNDGFYDARPFKNGLSNISQRTDIHESKFGRDIVTDGYKFGFMNKKGEVIIPVDFDDADDFMNGTARFRKGTKFGVIDSNGNVIVQPNYFNIGRFFDELAVVDAGGRYGFVDKAGKEVIKPVYEYALDFSEGLAGVRMEGKYGFVNKEGEIVIKPQYEAVRPFSEGLAAVKLNGKWGFIDAKGKLKLSYVFDDATLFGDDRCPVLLKRKWGFIDATGRLIIPAEFDAVGTFNDGVAEVMRGQISVYVNKNGTVLPMLK